MVGSNFKLKRKYNNSGSIQEKINRAILEFFLKICWVFV
jgi:hypothetical protein